MRFARPLLQAVQPVKETTGIVGLEVIPNGREVLGRGLHSFTFQLNLSRV